MANTVMAMRPHSGRLNANELIGSITMGKRAIRTIKAIMPFVKDTRRSDKLPKPENSKMANSTVAKAATG